MKETLFIILDPGESRVVGGCELTAVDANHCPGSVMFVIRLRSGVTLLHVGDCRAGHSMEEEPVFWNTRIDKLYLDTTYCRPEYDFPSPGQKRVLPVRAAAPRGTISSIRHGEPPQPG